MLYSSIFKNITFFSNGKYSRKKGAGNIYSLSDIFYSFTGTLEVTLKIWVEKHLIKLAAI